MILLISFCYVHDLVPKNFADGWKAEVSKGGFVRHCRGKREPSGKPEHAEGGEGTGDGVDEEAEEDSEGADASSLLPCPVEGCISTYQRYHNLERHLLFGKCKLVSEKYTLLDTAKLAYAEKVQEGFTTQPTLAAPTTTEVSSEATSITSSRLDRRAAIKSTLRRCHVTCAMLERITVSGASTWKSS